MVFGNLVGCIAPAAVVEGILPAAAAAGGSYSAALIHHVAGSHFAEVVRRTPELAGLHRDSRPKAEGRRQNRCRTLKGPGDKGCAERVLASS